MIFKDAESSRIPTEIMFYGPVFSQVLGYTGRINKDEYSNSTGYAINDYIGKTGLEKYYETYLRGVPGQSKFVKSATGSQSGSQTVVQPEAGDNLVLNIDADLQTQLYNALAKNFQKYGRQKKELLLPWIQEPELF